MRKPLLIVLTTGLLAIGVAACGGSSGHAVAVASSTSAATSGASAAAPASRGGAVASRISISAAKSGALMFDTKSLHAAAGTVTITFTNDSPEDHNLTLVRASGASVAATPTFDRGSRTLTVHLIAGTYTYFCSVPGHRQAGMQGTLTVS